jgi:hypothetical protein
MSASYSRVQAPQKTRKGLAIASLVLGIINIPTFGLWVIRDTDMLCRYIEPIISIPTPGLWLIGAILGIMLAAFALNGIKKAPMTYGGMWIAKTGVYTNAFSLAFLVFAPDLLVLIDNVKLGRQTAALNSLRTIHNTQAEFKAVNSRFATLRELAESGLIDQPYADGSVIRGFVYSSSDVSAETYCVHADRVCDSTGYRDYVVCEDGAIRYVESATRGTVRRGEGTPLSEVWR